MKIFAGNLKFLPISPPAIMSLAKFLSREYFYPVLIKDYNNVDVVTFVVLVNSVTGLGKILFCSTKFFLLYSIFRCYTMYIH